MADRPLIQVSETKPALITCGKCRKENLIDLTPFNKDVSNILRDNCVHCGGELFVGVLILCNTELRDLLSSIGAITNLFRQQGAHVNEM